MKNKEIIFSLILIVFLGGCSTFQTNSRTNKINPSSPATTLVHELYKSIDRSRVGNQASIQVNGFPYLRSNRYLVALKDRNLNANNHNIWIDHMRTLANQGLHQEIENLPTIEIERINAQLNTKYSRVELYTQIKSNLDVLYENDQRDPDFIQHVLKAVRNRSQYSILPKIYGLYPLFYVPTRLATNKAYDEFRKWHQQSFDDYEPFAQMITFDVKQRKQLTGEQIKNLYKDIPTDSFGTPYPTPQQKEDLLLTFAPIIHQDVDADFDRFGEVRWLDGNVTIDPERPTVYYYISHAFINHQPVLQLNYSFWYSGRMGPNAPRLEKGKLDGLTLRITLDTDGVPVMIDTTNNCGCYQFFVPNMDKVQSVIDVSGLDALVVRTMPEQFPNHPLAIKINTGWHQIVRLTAQQTPTQKQNYALINYSELESLPHSDGRRESVFNSKGIMKNSHRIEPLLFFPSGVKKVGYMRQRNNQPIKLIGEAHFSDPYLFDKNFIFK